MALRAVTDPELLAQLNAQPARRPVSDPEILRQLNGEAEAPERSIGQEFGRQLGLAGRYAVEGGLGLAGTLANPLAYIANKGLETVGADYRFPDQNALISQTLTDAGLPQPESRQEEVIGSLSRGVAGAGTGLGVARQVANAPSQITSQVGRTMAQQPLVQGVAGATGPAGSELAKEMGGGPIAQFAAGLGGAMVPGAAASGAPMATRAAFRGGERGRQQMEQNIRTFADAGTTASVGQATERRVLRAAETALANAPGSGGVMASKVAGQADDLASTIEKRASQLMRKTSGEQAGRAIEKGIRGSGGFVERFRGEQERLYTALDNFIQPDKPVTVTNTQRALQELSTPIPGAEATSKSLINPKIAKLAQDISTDSAGGTVPYQAIKELRTLIGQQMDDALVGDVPRSQWKRVYGALSDDMREAADSSGPQAKASWTRANNYTKAGMKRMEAIESVVQKNGGPEAIFRAATSGTREGATTLRAVMQSLDEGGQKTVSATVLRRLGIANPSNQDDLGEQFSTGTFLTNWAKLSPEAKRTLFDRYGPKFREDIDTISKVSANLRQGSEVFRNTSGTARQQALWGTVGAFALAAVSGNVPMMAKIGTVVGSANLAARLMTNPRFVRWLAQSTKHPTAHTPSLINNLAQQARDTGDEDLALAAAWLEKEASKQPQQADR